ncbi:Gfo/Idh/MocA family oxidoreductase [Microbacterium sp. EYE_5]|uniref:Gfo/Idh/MocA family protein n=1 Tax=unclassified Microbacterium TaxID=2609290 RepID=UPI002005A491|nr:MULTISPECIES: Gfo/Idh/MocA family oxidoreductase [unclassified Microbacterium]MCK6081177.1 Gfo/Idh/MocA family oxidoreductase [Microbacterium sp. EYE_382]MCK6086447.1 Gfo/Idh/MocA family oxidoreductase [Microbacterium sp. EYE_384]MCK6124055.1 Gfo/Idh/MocA family oxidoreductase [Microbacterium sp. EYE_80]MCK6126964.1 Gfo/Idh/MocA family oxidoreductase [Microbacterium sp. EYE_79]MCK6142132.1 Gfo/Idh/MocA family oxidoreductase [Microbacterium sp. EYE_39]
MTALRWGILATGGIAHAFTSDLRTAGLTVTAVGSRRLEAAQAFAEQYAIPSAYGSYEELVAAPDVDIVYIATPHSHHRDNALLALENGTHVLIEKPLTLDAAQAAEIRDAAAARGLLAMEAMWTRYLPHMVRLRELLASGAIGEVRALSADHTQNLPTDPTHRLNALELGGGALLDLGIYPISFAWDVLGRPTAVSALGRLGDTGADTEAAISLVHGSGAVSSLLTSMRGAGANVAQIIGTEGRIVIDSVWYTPTSFRVHDRDGAVREEFHSEVDGRGMQYQALHAEQLIREGRTDSELLGMDESVAIMGTLDEIRAQLGVVYPQS